MSPCAEIKTLNHHHKRLSVLRANLMTLPQWGVYDIETDTRVNLADGMEPIVLDETTDAVFNLEASVFVLKFHFYEPQ